MAVIENGQTFSPGAYQSFLNSVYASLSAGVSPGASNTQSSPGTPDPGALIWPSTKTALSGYHYSDSHHGVDIGQNVGDPIVAPFNGTVVFAGWNNQGYGNLVIIKDDQGRYRSYEAHLSKLYVKSGDRVNAGQMVGAAGSTGNSTGPHLHFELRNAAGTGFYNPYDVFGTNPKPGQVISPATITGYTGEPATAGAPGSSVNLGTGNNPFLAPAQSGNNAPSQPGSPVNDVLGISGPWGEVKSFFGRVRWLNIGAVLLGIIVAVLGLSVIVKSEGEAAIGQTIGNALGTALKNANNS